MTYISCIFTDRFSIIHKVFLAAFIQGCQNCTTDTQQNNCIVILSVFLLDIERITSTFTINFTKLSLHVSNQYIYFNLFLIFFSCFNNATYGKRERGETSHIFVKQLHVLCIPLLDQYYVYSLKVTNMFYLNMLKKE